MTTSLKGGTSTGEIQVNGVTKLTLGDNGILTATVTPTSATPKALATMDALPPAIGVGQTWQDVTASRALGVNYTNSTGRPIQVSARMASDVAFSPRIAVDGVTMLGTQASSNADAPCVIVPNGSVYQAQVTAGTGTLVSWRELR